MSYRTPEEVAKDDYPVLWKASRRSSGEFTDVLACIIREDRRETLEELGRRMVVAGIWDRAESRKALAQMLAELEPKPKEPQPVVLDALQAGARFRRTDEANQEDKWFSRKWNNGDLTITCVNQVGKVYHLRYDTLVVPVEDKR